ncbi:MAG: hypothetical protein GY776_22370, partial [Alteromonas sp.]|nr:hypothetical protein [Alteromonas sp.]
MSTLLQRTNSLAEELNRGRIAIENSLDNKASLNGEISKSTGVNLARVATGKDSDEKNRLQYSMPMLHREDAFERKSLDTYQHVKLQDEKTKVCELKPTTGLRTSRFKTWKAPVNLDSSFPQPAFTKQAVKKPLGHATSLPNLRLASLVDIPRNKTKRATGKTISPMQPINRYRSGLTTLRPPTNAIAFDSLSLRSRYGDKDDVESLDSRSTKSWTATSSIKRDKSPRLVLKRQCYNTNSGKMVRMTNLFSSIT